MTSTLKPMLLAATLAATPMLSHALNGITAHGATAIERNGAPKLRSSPTAASTRMIVPAAGASTICCSSSTRKVATTWPAVIGVPTGSASTSVATCGARIEVSDCA